MTLLNLIHHVSRVDYQLLCHHQICDYVFARTLPETIHSFLNNQGGSSHKPNSRNSMYHLFPIQLRIQLQHPMNNPILWNNQLYQRSIGICHDLHSNCIRPFQSNFSDISNRISWGLFIISPQSNHLTSSLAICDIVNHH